MRAIAEMLERNLLEHVIRPIGVEQIARQDRVDTETSQRDAGARQDEYRQ